MDVKLLSCRKSIIAGVSAFLTVLPAFAGECIAPDFDTPNTPVNTSLTGSTSFIDAPAAPLGAPITVYGTELQGPLVVGGKTLSDCPYMNETVFEESRAGMRLAKTTCWLNDVPIGSTTVNAGGGDNLELEVYDGEVEVVSSFESFKLAMKNPEPGDFFLLQGFTADLSVDGYANGGSHILWMRDGEHMATENRPIALVGYPGNEALFKVDGLANGHRAIGLDNDGWIISNLDFDSSWNAIQARGEVRVVGNRVRGLTGAQRGAGTGSVMLGGNRKGSLFAGNVVSGGRTGWRFDHAVYVSDCPSERGWEVKWNHMVDNDFSRGPHFVVNHQSPRCGSELENRSAGAHTISHNVIDSSRNRGRCIGVSSFGWMPDYNSTAPGITTVSDNTLINCGYIGKEIDQFGDARVGAAIYAAEGNTIVERNLLISPQRAVQIGTTATNARPEGFMPTIIRNNRFVQPTGDLILQLLHSDLRPLVEVYDNTVE